MTTRLVEVRPPTPEEHKEHGGEVVFVRKDRREMHLIYASRCYEGWQQWGAPVEVLGDNVEDVERWRQCFSFPDGDGD
jgi:hypothetical protein